MSEGEIFYDDERFTRDRVDQRRRFGFLPDFPIFFNEMTPLEHVGMALRLYERDGPGAEDRVLDLFRGFDLMPLANTPLLALSRAGRFTKSRSRP